MNGQISSEAYAILQKREELRLNSYLDSNGTPTIGWGCTYYENGAKVKLGQKITLDRAVQLYNYHIGVAASIVNKYISANLNQGQFDALVSFAFNAGGPQFSASTLRVVVNNNPNDLDAVEAQFMRWVYETKNGVKVVNQGLINRRKEEVAIYRSGTGSLKKNSDFILILLIIALLILIKRK